jgi:integrase/recombinase XerC
MQGKEGPVPQAASDAGVALARVLGSGVRPLRLEETVFQAMLDGWSAQQTSRHLMPDTIKQRVQLIRRAVAHLGEWPWEWMAQAVEEFIVDLSSGRLARSTMRSYQGSLKVFLEHISDGRYPWSEICEQEFGRRPQQLFDHLNLTRHLSELEGDPGNRPLTRSELARFFDFCDEQVAEKQRKHRKGTLAAFRDAALFKLLYAWGLRRGEASMLDVVDFGPNPAMAAFGRFGSVRVRHGKGSKGSGPRYRVVLTVFDWAPRVLDQYLERVRPLYGRDEHPALFLTERGGRLQRAYIGRRFAEYRDRLDLPKELSPHCLRHSHITHLIEDGWDGAFVQAQAGHKFGSTTALYTGVSSDYKNKVLLTNIRKQLHRGDYHAG